MINNIIRVIGLSHKKLGEPSLINSDLLNVSSISPPSTKAFVLGGLMEETLRRSLLISDGSPNFLWDRPITLIILLITITIVGWQIFSTFRKKN